MRELEAAVREAEQLVRLNSTSLHTSLCAATSSVITAVSLGSCCSA